MFSDTLFRIVNVAGGLGLDDELWRRDVIGLPPARPRSGAIRRRIDATLAGGERVAPPADEAPVQPHLRRSSA